VYVHIELAVGWRGGAPRSRQQQAGDLARLEELWANGERPLGFDNIFTVISGLLMVNCRDRWTLERALVSVRALNVDNDETSN